MAEAIGFSIVENVLTNLGSFVVQEIGSALGVEKDLERLKTILSTIQAVLRDAEEQQLNNHELRLWLWRIKDASYEADDILDDFEIAALRQNLKIQHHGNTTKKVFRFAFSLSSFRFKMSHRIKEVRLKFDEIAEDRIKFHLTEKSAKNVVGVGLSDDAERGQTDSFVDESQVFGREGDKHEIGKLLLDMEGEDDLSVVAIQGMGGLGKTTLAQFVYNDKRADTYFKLKMWVCVSLQFDVKLITAKVLESAFHNKRSKLEMSVGQFGMGQSQFRNLEMDQLQSQLRGQLQGKRFLLVLDDVWNEDAEKWDNLKKLLTGGAKGSKVLVTTRSKKVASIMGAAVATTYHLKGLSDDDCWDLFKERAFARGQEEAHPNLVVIGKEIVKKCGGVPIAAKSLGSLMRFETDENKWKNDNEIWRLRQNENGIIRALRLSYNHLPFDLKQCFAYCCLFSKGEEIYKEELIQMWISQGLIVHPSGDYQCLWNIGEEYVKELALRSFFEFINEYQRKLKMHDLINDIARDVAGKECINWERATNVPSPKEVRHVSCSDMDDVIPCDELGSMHAFSNARTLRLAVESLVDDFFTNFRSLRVLVVKIVSGSCPSSIGKLKHLRFLEIDSKHIQSLPKSITKLQCLQHLRIYCPKLRELPMDIEKMVNLRSLVIHPDAPLSHMPPGLRSLTSLRKLTLFIVGRGIGCKLNDLHGLIHLGGFFKIRNLENVSRAVDSAEANLREKQIQGLVLEWNNQDSRGHAISSGEETHVAVLETLQPHPNIQRLDINGYRGVSFPSWLMEPLMFPKMVGISLENCDKCQHLPPFWKLPSLKILSLFRMDALQCMESRVERGGQQVWFPSLTKLYVAGVPNLESLTPRAANNGIQEEEEESEENPLSVLSFPSLEDLKLLRCSAKLVRSLLIIGKDNPSSSPPNSFLAKLKYFLEKLVRSLLLIIGKVNPSSSPPNSSLAKLKVLQIVGCDDLESLPEGALQSSTSLEKLELISCPNLVINSDSLSAADAGGMEFLTSLKLVKFKQLPKLVSLPEGIQNAAAKLQILIIEDCEGLMYLPDWMVNLTLLQQLELSKCDHLTSRCQKDTGEDWPKISHIPTIKLDGVIIQDK